MTRPVQGSDLAEQIELARQNLERWPEWLKDAAGVGGKEVAESAAAQKPSEGRLRLSDADFID